MLMRHWSLYDSMFYSTYLATRMATWTVNGRQSLETFIARMGYVCVCDALPPSLSSWQLLASRRLPAFFVLFDSRTMGVIPRTYVPPRDCANRLSLREIREKYTVMSSRLKDNLRAKVRCDFFLFVNFSFLCSRDRFSPSHRAACIGL